MPRLRRSLLVLGLLGLMVFGSAVIASAEPAEAPAASPWVSWLFDWLTEAPDAPRLTGAASTPHAPPGDDAVTDDLSAGIQGWTVQSDSGSQSEALPTSDPDG